MWIARDKDGSLWLFENKPIKENDVWNCPNHVSAYMKILDTTGQLFPEIKWEDEPVEVNLVDVNKSFITDKYCIDEVYWREVRNNAAIAAMQSILEKWNNVSLNSIVIGEACKLSVDCADALIQKLKSKENKI